VRFLSLIIVGYCLSGCATVPLNSPVPVGSAKLYVVGRGWHTDIGLPTNEISSPLATLEHGFPGVRFMVFGFGERQYYMARNAGSGETLGALFPSKSAILLTALNAAPDRAFANYQVVTLHLPQQSIDRVAAALWDAFERDSAGNAVRLAGGPYPGSVFFASRETYDALDTCNTWTARMLSKGGIPVDPRGVLFATQVMQQVAQIAAMQAK
jgi:uncharacterized protein (TIGR02117 family)